MKHTDNTDSLRLLFTHEMHSWRVGDNYFNPSIIGYKNLELYLHSIPEGTLVTRCQGPSDKSADDWVQINGEHIDIEPIPDVRSMAQMIKKFFAINKAVGRALKKTDRSIVRLPGACGLPVALALWLRGHKYGVEFVGHPTESILEQLAKKGRKPGLSVKLVDWANKFFVRRSVAVGYRSDYLRKAFPHGNPEREVIFSGAQLLKEVITQPRSKEQLDDGSFRIIYIGRISAEKGCHVLLEAFAKAASQIGKPMALRMVGDGPDVDTLKARTVELGLGDKVEFTGRIQWGAELFAKLDDAHLFVLPSLTEGMPRSLIEAMARGMPALGSNCGGIPELLEAENLFTPGDDNALAEKLIELSDKPEKLAAMSERNFEASKQHWPENLDREKSRFWALVVKYAK